MNQKEIWIDLMQEAKYELDTCSDALNPFSDDCNGLQEIMEQVEVTGRHLLNLALEMQQELKKQ